jgi:hypothetical protein
MSSHNLSDNQAIKSFIEKTKQLKKLENINLTSGNRLRDLSGNMKIFKTTNDYVATKHQDRNSMVAGNAANMLPGSSHLLDTISKHRKSHSYRNKSSLISKYQKINIPESRIKNIKIPSEVSFK